MTDQTRANFEAHFQLTTRQAWQHKDGSYQFPEIQAKWEGYLAGVAKAGPVAAMTDDDIIKLAQQFNVRKTWAEAAAETVSYRFDAMGFAHALLAAAAPGADASTLKRYDGYCSYDGGGPAIMEESSDGQYVLFDDLARLWR